MSLREYYLRDKFAPSVLPTTQARLGELVESIAGKWFKLIADDPDRWVPTVPQFVVLSEPEVMSTPVVSAYMIPETNNEIGRVLEAKDIDIENMMTARVMAHHDVVLGVINVTAGVLLKSRGVESVVGAWISWPGDDVYNAFGYPIEGRDHFLMLAHFLGLTCEHMSPEAVVAATPVDDLRKAPASFASYERTLLRARPPWRAYRYYLMDLRRDGQAFQDASAFQGVAPAVTLERSAVAVDVWTENTPGVSLPDGANLATLDGIEESED